MFRRHRPDKDFRSLAGRAAAVLGLLAAGALAAAAAQPVPMRYDPPWQDDPPIMRAAARGPLTLQQAVAIAMRRYDGRVVRAETKIINGARVYEIRMIDSSGRVRTVRIDAKTGQFR